MSGKSEVFVDAFDDSTEDDSMTIEMTETHDSFGEMGTSSRYGGGRPDNRRGLRDHAPPTMSPSHFPSNVGVGGYKSTGSLGPHGSPTQQTLGSLGHADSHRFKDVSEEEEFTDLEREKIDDDLLGDLGLADFMLLAYTISNIYQRHKARSRKAKLDDSEVVGHDETLLFIVVALYAASVLTMSLTLMGGGIVCRPLSVGLGAFATGSGGITPGGFFEYGFDFINRVCETQIKLETSQFWPVFTMVTFLLLFIGAVFNSNFINQYNRYHAIARRQYHSPLIGKEAVRASEREPGQFEKFYKKFMIAKAFGIVMSVGMLSTFWYTVLTFATIQETVDSDTGDVSYTGGNLLTRGGAVCDGSTLSFEEQFDAQYRCHLKGEAQMHYLKYLVLFSASLVVLVSIYQTVMMSLIHNGYLRWKKVHEERTSQAQREQTVPDQITPEMTSMFKMTRGLLRLIMYYLKPSPPDGDLPGLIAKAVFGLQPEPDEMATISSKMLTEFASPTETSEMLMSFMKGVLGEHIGESDDVRKIVLATVTAWKDSSTQRYLKGIVDTINAIHKDDPSRNQMPSPRRRDYDDNNSREHERRNERRTPPPQRRGEYPGTTPNRRREPRVDALAHSDSVRDRMNG